MKKFLIGLSEPGLLLKKTDQLLIQLIHLHGELPNLDHGEAGNWDISAPGFLQTTCSPSHSRGGQTELENIWCYPLLSQHCWAAEVSGWSVSLPWLAKMQNGTHNNVAMKCESHKDKDKKNVGKEEIFVTLHPPPLFITVEMTEREQAPAKEYSG